MWLCGGGERSAPSDPVVDIERLLVNYAWKELAEPSCLDRLMKNRKYRLEVNWGYVDISHRVTSFEPWFGGGSIVESRHTESKSNMVKRDLCLFRTEFMNESNEAQNFTFKTERTTTSRCDITLLQGLRIGSNVDVKVSIPAVNACRITGGLSGELQVSKSTGQTFEEQLTWSVDSQVKVEGKSRAIAALMIREEEINMDMTVDSVVTARRDHIPVYVRHRKTGRLVKRLGIPSRQLSVILSESEGFEKVGDCSVKRETKGVVRLLYGAEQVIDLKTLPLGSREELVPLNRDRQQTTTDGTIAISKDVQQLTESLSILSAN